MQKQERYQGDATINDLQIRQKVLNLLTSQEDHIVNLTKNSVEIFINSDKKSLDSSGKLKGIDCTNWFTMDVFNRKFKLVQ